MPAQPQGLQALSRPPYAVEISPADLDQLGLEEEVFSAVACTPSRVRTNSGRRNAAATKMKLTSQQQQQASRYLWQDLQVELLERVFWLLERSEAAWPARACLVGMGGVCVAWRRVVLEQLCALPWLRDGAVDYVHPGRLVAPPPCTVECFVRRERAGGSWRKNRRCRYSLYLGPDYTSASCKLLLSATKVSSMLGSKLVITTHPSLHEKKGAGCLAVLSSNIIGTKFQMRYRAQSEEHQAVQSLSAGAQRHGAITYKCNVLGMQGPRRLAVKFDTPAPSSPLPSGSAVCPLPAFAEPSTPRDHISPSPSNLDSPSSTPAIPTDLPDVQLTMLDTPDTSSSFPFSSPSSTTSSLPASPVVTRPPKKYAQFPVDMPHTTWAAGGGAAQGKGKGEGLELRNKAPRWHDELQCWCLDFQGRVTQASVKNFQLVHPDSEDVVLQFGKVGKNLFTLDFKQPFSLVQAFSICLSAFEFKLACE